MYPLVYLIAKDRYFSASTFAGHQALSYVTMSHRHSSQFFMTRACFWTFLFPNQHKVRKENPHSTEYCSSVSRASSVHDSFPAKAHLGHSITEKDLRSLPKSLLSALGTYGLLQRTKLSILPYRNCESHSSCKIATAEHGSHCHHCLRFPQF